MEITSNALQTVAANAHVLFTETAVPGNCSIMHREGSGLVKLRGLTRTQCRARFKASFYGNIAVPATGTPGAISLALTVDGEPVNTTQMIVTPTVRDNFFNVGASIYLDVPACCCSTIGITNTSNQAISVQNANFIVERVA